MNTLNSTELLASVVIATFNRRALLLRQLNALLSQDLPVSNYEVIVVNDGSSDGTIEMVHKLQAVHSNLILVNLHNSGPASARNAGARIARGRVLAFTDDDCVATPGWLHQILSPFDDPSVVVVQGRTTTDSPRITPLTHQIEVLSLSSAVPTCNAAYRKDVFLARGGFDVRFRFAHNEDADLAWRIESSGKIAFEPGAQMQHPPRPDPIGKHLGWGRHLESEFALYCMHPDLYRQRRYRSPWITIYWRIFFIGQFSELKSSLRYLLRTFDPRNFSLAIVFLTVRWINMLRFLPLYFQASRLYKSLIPHAGAFEQRKAPSP